MVLHELQKTFILLLGGFFYTIFVQQLSFLILFLGVGVSEVSEKVLCGRRLRLLDVLASHKVNVLAWGLNLGSRVRLLSLVAITFGFDLSRLKHIAVLPPVKLSVFHKRGLVHHFRKLQESLVL